MAYGAQIKKVAQALARAAQTPTGQAIIKELVGVAGEYAREAIRQRHQFPAGRDGHPHLVKAVDARTQQEWEMHLRDAVNSYSGHASSTVSHESFYACFWTAVASAKYGDWLTAKKFLNQAYRIGEALLFDAQGNPRRSDDTAEHQRRLAVAHVLDEIAPILNPRLVK